MLPGVLHKFKEVHRMICIGHFIVVGDLRANLFHLLQLLFHHQAIGIALRSRLNQETKQLKPRGNPLQRVFDALRPVKHHFPNHRANKTARLCVVADKCNSIRREQLSAERQQAIAHRLWDPGIEPVRNDVIELAELRPCVEQVALK